LDILNDQSMEYLYAYLYFYVVIPLMIEKQNKVHRKKVKIYSYDVITSIIKIKKIILKLTAFVWKSTSL